MITNLYLNNTELTGTKRVCTSISSAFPILNYTSNDKGSAYGSKVSLGKPRGFKFSVEFVIVGTDFSDLATEKEIFLKMLGDIVVAEGAILKIVKSNLKELQVVVKGVNVTGSITAQDGNSCVLLIEFQTENPFFTSTIEKSNEVFIFSGGGMEVPMSVPMDLSAGGLDSLTTIQVGGTFKSFPILRFYGELITPSFYNQTTDELLNLNLTLDDSTEWVEIDTYLKTAVDQSGNNVRANISGTFPSLIVGNNVLVLSSASYNETGKVIVSYRDTFFGL
jgi:hypothetical protein